MLRLFLGSVLVLVFSVGFVTADNKNFNKTKHTQKATITKVDAKNGTVTVRMKNQEGKEVQKTFKLTGDVVYFDSTGNVAAADIFRSGNDVLVVEEEGNLRELHQGHGQEATITKVNKQARTITVRMKDKTGRESEKTLKLSPDTVFFDNTGRECSLNDFHSGNEVRVILQGGHVKELQKENTGNKGHL